VRLQREAFALREAGFFVAPRLVDLAGYNVEALEEERGLLVLLLPTWTGGAPPPAGASLHAHLRELVADFRVGRGALRALSVATFGLGSREYGGDWCRASFECHAWMVALGARELIPGGAAKGDDSGDMAAAFGVWCAGALLPAVCEAYAEAYGVEEEEEEAAAEETRGEGGCGAAACSGGGGGAGGGGCASGAAAAGAGSGGGCGGGGEGGACSGSGCGAGDCGAAAAPRQKEFLPRKVYRRAKKAAREAAEDAAREAALLAARAVAAAAAASAASPEDGSAAPSAADAEEDALNDALLALPAGGTEASGAAAAAPRGRRSAAIGRRASERQPPPSAPAPGGGSEEEDSGVEEGGGSGGEGLVDVEDVGNVVAAAAAAAAAEAAAAASSGAAREMVTAAQRRALTKEGYKIIGSHSAVKLCRWTKAQLRGRGGCYKHTFYGARVFHAALVFSPSCFSYNPPPPPLPSFQASPRTNAWRPRRPSRAPTSAPFAGGTTRTPLAARGGGAWTPPSSSWRARSPSTRPW
jgi:hypothetical protein